MMVTIEEIKEEFLKEKQGIYEAIGRDYRNNYINVEFNKLLDIFQKIENEKFEENAKAQVITIIYNGNPYVTLELAIKGLLSNSNLILISENVMEKLNEQIIDIMRKIISNKNLKSIIKWYPDGDIDKVSEVEDITNKIMFLGDKRIYRKLNGKVEMPIIYNGYGSIIIYTDDEDEFEDQIYEIKDYAIENNISVNVYNGEINEDIESINKDGINYICIIFSNDISKTEQFEKMVKSNYVLVNNTNIENMALKLPKEIWN